MSKVSIGTNMDLKDLLKSGVSAEDIMNELQGQVQRAQEAVEAEKNANKVMIEETRSTLVDAACDWAYALTGHAADGKDRESMITILKNIEKEIDELDMFFNAIMETKAKRKDKKEETPDDVIERFLRSLV